MKGLLTHVMYGEHTIRKACLTCPSGLKNILDKNHKPILMILAICDKYAPKQ